MNWKKFKKLIITLIIIKIIIFVFLVFKSDLVSISREINFSGNYEQVTESDTIIQKRQRLIWIVRNEEERGIIIKLRGKKNGKPFADSHRELENPIID